MRDALPGKPGASAGRACAAGSSAPAMSHRRRSCCAPGRASAIPQLLGAIAALNERRSGRSDRSADFRVLASWFAECADDARGPPAGARRLRPQSRAAFLARTPTRMASCRQHALGRRAAARRSIRGCANMAKRRRAARCRGCSDRCGGARTAGAASSPRNRRRSKPRASASPPASRRGCPSSATSTRMRSACSWDCSAKRWPSRAGPEAAVERQTGDGLLHIQPEAAGRRQPRRDRHAARRLFRPRPPDHHHAGAGRPMSAMPTAETAAASASQQRQPARGIPRAPCARC